MILVPAATPVTRPVVFTVASAVVADVHGLVVAAVPEPVSWVAEPTQVLNVPVIVGMAVTVTVAVFTHPLLSV